MVDSVDDDSDVVDSVDDDSDVVDSVDILCGPLADSIDDVSD